MADYNTTIDNAQALTEKLAAMRQTQRVFAGYSQEQVDRIFFEAAKASPWRRWP